MEHKFRECVDVRKGLESGNGRIWCQESSNGQWWLHQRTPCLEGPSVGTVQAENGEMRMRTGLLGALPPPAAGTGAQSSSGAGKEGLLVPLGAPPAAPTSPVTFTSTALTSEDDIIKSDGCNNACCARSSCQVRRKKRGEGMLREGVGDGACVSPSPAQCQTGSTHTDVIGKVHCRSITAANKRENIGLNDSTGKSNIHIFRGGNTKLSCAGTRAMASQPFYPIKMEAACTPFVQLGLGSIIARKKKKDSQRFKEASDQALNAFSFYSIHISSRALWSE